ncbi:MAG: TIGR03619 family F420-dependent LLM class oxidoreductase, partial [Chloroflexota bacterium]|nr:TIGR03619 family F420-dependent LLM class oxidoreductase [Chloroflexota bacterium]
HILVAAEDELQNQGDRQTQYVRRARQKVFDPLMVLSFLASRTDTVKLGTSILVLPLRHPAVSARLIASLDVLSAGRAIAGVGAGWMRAEFKALGVSYEEAGRRTDEYIQAMQALWTQDQPRFSGGYVAFDGVEFNLPCVQRPHPPIWVGGRTKYSLRRAVRFAAAWHPSHLTVAEFKAHRPDIERLCTEFDRDPATLALTTRRAFAGVMADTSIEPTQRRVLGGSVDEVLGDIRALAEAGISHLLLEFTSKDRAEVEDQIRWLAAEVLPSVKAMAV